MRIPRSDWVEALTAFNERNAAHCAVLEVDEAEAGSQREASGYELVGADYDPRDDRLAVMLGDGRESRLTHSIGHPTSVDLLRDDDGRYEMLRVGHPRGQVLLHVARPAGRDR